MITINDIERQTLAYVNARQALADIVDDLQRTIEAEQRKRLPAIKRAVARAAEAHAALQADIGGAPELFVKPRSVIFHGVRIGYRKGSGAIAWEEDDVVAARLRKILGDAADAYIKVTEKPIKKALQNLDATTLRRAGITVEDTGDVVFIKAADSAVDKVVKALLKNAVDEEMAA